MIKNLQNDQNILIGTFKMIRAIRAGSPESPLWF